MFVAPQTRSVVVFVVHCSTGTGSCIVTVLVAATLPVALLAGGLTAANEIDAMNAMYTAFGSPSNPDWSSGDPCASGWYVAASVDIPIDFLACLLVLLGAVVGGRRLPSIAPTRSHVSCPV